MSNGRDESERMLPRREATKAQFAALALPMAEPLNAPDWISVGLVLAIVGCFLLANGILFRNPRAMIAERLGQAPAPLRRIREVVFHRVQMALGFLFLVAGFGAQLYGRTQPPPSEASSPALWIGSTVVLAVVLEVVGWWWSLRELRRHVRAFLRENPPDFETDTSLAREVGELFGIGSQRDETVQSYAARVRASLGLPTVVRTGPRARASDERRAFVPPTFGDDTDAGFDD